MPLTATNGLKTNTPKTSPILTLVGRIDKIDRNGLSHV